MEQKMQSSAIRERSLGRLIKVSRPPTRPAPADAVRAAPGGRQRTYIGRAETRGMDDRLERVIRQQLRKAGRQFEEAKRAYAEGRDDPDGDAAAAARFDLPTDGDGRARIVCRRYAERRTVPVDDEGRPACFAPGHADCEGCAEDVRDGVVETW
jgi:hypothetical protein